MRRSFFDTNVFVYLFDTSVPTKQNRAEELFEKESAAGSLLLSTQVLQEFYVTVTRKLEQPLSPQVAQRAVQDLAEYPVIGVDVATVIAAVARSQRSGFSLWDSLVVEAALTGGADLLLTEDLQHGQVIDGLRVENPFAS